MAGNHRKRQRDLPSSGTLELAELPTNPSPEFYHSINNYVYCGSINFATPFRLIVHAVVKNMTISTDFMSYNIPDF